MRLAVLTLLAVVCIAVPSTGARSRPERAATLTFNVVNMKGERRALSRHAIDPYAYSLSPDHKQLAYIPQTSNGRPLKPTMVAPVRAGGERVLADPFLHVSWAPDGRHIALNGPRGSEHGLFFVNPDGSGFRHVANSGAVVWSPDSKSLVSTRPISVLSLETGQERYLSGGHSPDWSPDGTRIAFAHNSNLNVVSVGTGTVRTLTRGTDPVWSPDGRRIAFIRFVGDAYHRTLWVISSRGGKPRLLARGLDRFAPFIWSPKGRQIAYVRGRTLFARNLSGREGRFLAHKRGADMRPLAWSGDGRRILYFSLIR
jgi:Tol biopolymer transport system component